VGKSSLLNRLAGQKSLARVSSSPGHTRLLNLFAARVPGDLVLPRFGLVDLPGYGYAAVSGDEQAKWHELVRGYFERRSNLRSFVFLVDVRRTPAPEDVALFRWLVGLGMTPLVAVTKAEKIHKSTYHKVRQDLAILLGTAPEAIIVTSSNTGLGFENLRLAIIGALSSQV
jgi:GTP-binding protein